MRVGGSNPAVLEIGPAVVRELSRPDAARRHGALAESALAGIDDSVVLVGDRPVCVDDLWRSLIRSVLGGRRGSVVVVYPSRWSPARIERVRAAAAAVARRVAVIARGEWLQGRTEAAVVVEVDAEFVTVSSAHAVAAFRHVADALTDAAPDAVVDAIAGDPGSRTGTVMIDAPRRADSTAATAIRHALLDRGVPAHRVALTTGLVGAQPGRGGGRRRHRVRAGLAAALLVAVGAAAGLSVNPIRPHDRPAPAGGSADETAGNTVNTLVEGRVAVQVPTGWTEQRITGGPGSRRVQVTSPDDPSLALHITQSFTPEVTLAETVESLRRAIAAQPPGVFVDFTAQARVAGRPAVTYRELRPARVIGWSVLQEGSTRISVGCQSRPGGEDGIRTACDQAVRSARELGGTQDGG